MRDLVLTYPRRIFDAGTIVCYRKRCARIAFKSFPSRYPGSKESCGGCNANLFKRIAHQRLSKTLVDAIHIELYWRERTNKQPLMQFRRPERCERKDV